MRRFSPSKKSMGGHASVSKGNVENAVDIKDMLGLAFGEVNPPPKAMSYLDGAVCVAVNDDVCTFMGPPLLDGKEVSEIDRSSGIREIFPRGGKPFLPSRSIVESALSDQFKGAINLVVGQKLHMEINRAGKGYPIGVITEGASVAVESNPSFRDTAQLRVCYEVPVEKFSPQP